MELQFHPGIPLLIGHFQNVDLGNRTGDVEKCIDASETVERLCHDGVRRLRAAHVEVERQRLGATRLDIISGAIEFHAAARHEHHAREVLRQPDGCCPADPLAGSGNDRDCIFHDCLIYHLNCSTGASAGEG